MLERQLCHEVGAWGRGPSGREATACGGLPDFSMEFDVRWNTNHLTFSKLPRVTVVVHAWCDIVLAGVE